MNTLTKLALRLNQGLNRGLNWRLNGPHNALSPSPSPLPRYFLMSDDLRLPDPAPVLARLPKGAAVVLRCRDAQQLHALAARITPLAHRLHIKVLVANDARLALKFKCDGVHLSQAQARRGPLRLNPKALPPGFIISAAAHDGLSLRRASRAHAHLVMLSPVFTTQSHEGAKSLGIRRFAKLARLSEIPVVALGGITALSAKRLSGLAAYGIAAIQAWRDE